MSQYLETREDGPQGLRFVAVGNTVYRGQAQICLAFTGNMAKRIANALNKYIPNKKGQ
jgi:hypothetical protein